MADTNDTEDAFIEKFESERSNDGYGLVMDKGTAERQEMAEVFDAPDVGTMAVEDSGDDAEDFMTDLASDAVPVEVGGPMAVASIEVTDLPPIAEAAPAAAATAPKKADSTDSITFGQAFKTARADGKSVFTWRGKRFNTKLKSEIVKKRAAAPVVEQATDEAIEPAPGAVPPQRAHSQAESTSGIGPRLNPAMQPKPDARGIYEGAVIGPNTRRELAAKIDRAKNAKVTPMTVTGEDGAQRPARSVAELMNARKAVQ